MSQQKKVRIIWAFLFIFPSGKLVKHIVKGERRKLTHVHYVLFVLEPDKKSLRGPRSSTEMAKGTNFYSFIYFSAQYSFRWVTIVVQKFGKGRGKWSFSQIPSQTFRSFEMRSEKRWSRRLDREKCIFREVSWVLEAGRIRKGLEREEKGQIHDIKIKISQCIQYYYVDIFKLREKLDPRYQICGEILTLFSGPRGIFHRETLFSS